MIVTEHVTETAAERSVSKSPAAFRTIAEVAGDLDLPAHVLRFWESKFPQIKPLKRRGGRRYYRPEDVALLRRVRSLLYTEGYTIKGVQRLLRDSGGRVPRAAEPAAPAPSEEATTVHSNVTEGTIRSAREPLRALLAELEAIRGLLGQR